MGREELPHESEGGGKGRQLSMYRDFDSFLKIAIREYYDRGWKSRRGHFIALLIASGQTSMAMAKDSMVQGSGTRNVAIGAATVVALRVGLRYALGGPLGLVLTVAASASLVSYFIRNQRDIVNKVGVYKKLIRDARERYDELYEGWHDGRYDTVDRNLMIDGLMKRFLQQIDET